MLAGRHPIERIEVSIDQSPDSNPQDRARDSRFDDAESDVDRGSPWRFREPDAPNPLTLEVTEWSTGVTKLGEAEFMNGVDRDSKRWSVLVGAFVLRKNLIDGLVEEWDDERKAFVETARLGRVEPGEVVSMMYLGDREGAKYDYPDFRVSRKPQQTTTSSEADAGTEASDEGSGEPVKGDDGIPF